MSIKEAAQGRSDIYRIDPRIIKVKPDWNSREENDPDNAAHIDMLARSIAEVGVKEPLTVYYEDDTIFVEDGHCRLAGAMRAIEVYAADVKTIPVKTGDRYSNEADRVFSQIVRNSGKPLSPFEQSKVFKRLIDLGWDEKAIASKSGLTTTWIKDLLNLQAAPEDVKKLVASGKVSASLAAATVKKEGKNAGKVLKGAVEAAKAGGKDKATKKHTKPKKAKVNEIDIFTAGWTAYAHATAGTTVEEAYSAWKVEQAK